MKICICSSMSAYAKLTALKEELEELGHTAFVPDLDVESEIKDMKDVPATRYSEVHGDIDVFPPKHEIWKKKGEAIRSHFKKIDESDCVLIANYKKQGVPDYIGGNTFLEIGHAFGSGKKIFILNNMPEQSAFEEEILGMQPVILKGDINNIK